MPASLPTLRIADHDVQIVEYRGERVVTFEQIDKVHKRSDGTAGRNYRDNRDRFEDGVDIFEPTSDEIRRMSEEGVFPPRTARGKLITRRGYFKIVKCLQDDLAWQIHGEMVEAYFAFLDGAATGTPERVAPTSNDPREIRLAMNQSLKLAKMAGLDGVHALHAASAQTLRLTGHDTLAAMGIAKLPAPEDERPLTPTLIGEQLGGMSARAVNLLLLEHGFQEKDERDEWRPTEKGREAGGHLIVAKRQHVEGTSYQLVWHRRIVATLRPLISAGKVVPLTPA